MRYRFECSLLRQYAHRIATKRIDVAQHGVMTQAAHASSREATKAPMGMPPPMPLAISKISGQPGIVRRQKVPVRPKPVCISSNTNQGAGFIAFCEGLQCIPYYRPYSGFALNGFHKHGGGGGCYFLKLSFVVKVECFCTGQGPETVLKTRRH